MADSPLRERLALLLGRIMAALAIIFFLPVLIFLALAIKLSSRGPVLHISERLGKDGQTFPMLKFRTMCVHAASALPTLLANNPHLRHQWHQRGKIQGDPRVTKLGRWLRRSSLDELPQLWNILRGEMAWVGPRPIISSEIAHYGQNYVKLQSIRPGLTGLWQVSGRSKLTYPERVAIDMRYIEHRGLRMDAVILLKTCGEIFLARGAI